MPPVGLVGEGEAWPQAAAAVATHLVTYDRPTMATWLPVGDGWWPVTGNADLDTTKIYLRLVPGRLKEDYDSAFPEIAVRGE